MESNMKYTNQKNALRLNFVKFNLIVLKKNEKKRWIILTELSYRFCIVKDLLYEK